MRHFSASVTDLHFYSFTGSVEQSFKNVRFDSQLKNTECGLFFISIYTKLKGIFSKVFYYRSLNSKLIIPFEKILGISGLNRPFRRSQIKHNVTIISKPHFTMAQRFPFFPNCYFIFGYRFWT